METRYFSTILYLTEEEYDDYLTREEWFYTILGRDKQGIKEAQVLLEIEQLIGGKLDFASRLWVTLISFSIYMIME